MRILPGSILAAIVLLGIGCGSKDKFDAAIAEMDALAAKLCACQDTACADAVQEELLAFRKTLKDKLGTTKPTDEQTRRGRESEKKLNDCRAKLSSTGFDAVLAQLAALKTRMCACADKPCADKVADEWKAYRATITDTLGASAKPDPEQDKRGSALDVELKACRERF